jgi:vacuolar protein sorting-associated protein 13A/C
MAKSLLLKVLVDVLGKYVEGLTEDNLKVGVWSGKIQLFNLKLKESALDELQLPVRVVKGSLKSLIVKVPWTQLESKPVEINIDGVYALACPLDLTKFTAEDAKKLSKTTKALKLRQIDDAIMAALKKENVQETAKKASYFQQLITRIVDNLEVSLKNIHIRYEDSQSDPGNTFAIGVTLDEILLSTTDENWNVRFVKRNSDSPISGVINKIAVMQNLGLYWNPKTFDSFQMPYDEWENFMLSSIYKTGMDKSSSSFQGFSYLLDPQNNLTLKLKHSEISNESTPNVDIVIETSTINFSADKYHYNQLMLVIDSFAYLDKRMYWSMYRPLVRPKADPRAWWFYAYRSVTGREISYSNKVICF